MTRTRTLSAALGLLGAGLLLSPAHATFPGPNGKVYFSSSRDGQTEIYAVNPDGSGPTRLTTEGGDAPAASRDGRRIAFQSTRGTGFNEIFVMNADGTGQTNLTNLGGDDTDPTWSPEGTRLVYARNDGGNLDIHAINVDGTGRVNLTNSPDGELAPNYSPDGSRIAYTRNVGSVDFEIWAMNPDGSGQTNLTNSLGSDHEPSFSPDGSRIAFWSMRDDNAEIYVMNADGSNPVRLTRNSNRDTSPVWSPDGTKIAFVSDRDGNDEVHFMNADGTGAVNLTANPAADSAPEWAVVPSVAQSTPAPASAPGSPAPMGGDGSPRPTLGRNAIAALARGTVRVRTPGGRFVSLSRGLRSLPIGSEIDATRGRIALSFETRRGGTQLATFYAGRFKIARQLPDGLVRLSLTEPLAGCSERATRSRLTATAAARRKKVRRLWGKGRGRFQTTGRFAAATVRGTEWLTEDRCTSTQVAVRSGVVAVFDRVRERTIVVRAGRRYIARP